MTDYTDLKRRLEAEKTVVSTTRTFPSGDERDMVLVPQYGPNPLAAEAAAAIAALEAEVARLKATSPQPAPPADKT